MGSCHVYKHAEKKFSRSVKCGPSVRLQIYYTSDIIRRRILFFFFSNFNLTVCQECVCAGEERGHSVLVELTVNGDNKKSGR